MDAINMAVVVVLCAGTAWLSHIGAAVFHDGLRPVLPEYLEGRMKRPELGSVAFGLSVGFIASVGISHTLATGILNPWLLFLTTDILGIISPKKWLAPILGGAWGALCLSSLTAINLVLTGLPVDLIGAMGALSSPVVSGFALFPLVAIFMQFGWKKGVAAAAITLVVRQLVMTFSSIYPESIQVFVGVLMLVAFAVFNDVKNKEGRSDALDNVFSQRTARIRKNAPWLMAVGAVIAVACNIGVFAGSEVSIYVLADAARQTGSAQSDLVNQAALAAFMRGLGFIPLIATTAVTTGVYGVAGFTFVYVVGYLMPNPFLAALAGAAIILLEILLLGSIGRALGKFPSIRAASDSIRSSMIMVMEFALLIGSISAVVAMGGYTGFFIGAMIYFVNELTGRRVMRMAIGPIAAIATGLLLNLLYLVGLFAPV